MELISLAIPPQIQVSVMVQFMKFPKLFDSKHSQLHLNYPITKVLPFATVRNGN